MFPKWFDKWNRDNPKDVFGPAILVGAVGGAVFVAAMLVSFGQPYATDSVQTGPRGTGMSVARFVNDAAQPDPTLENYFSSEPWIPEEGEELAGDIYENVQVLGHLTDANFNRLMASMTDWVGAGDAGCAYCHAGADEGNYADDELYTKIVSRSMIQMTQSINDEWIGHVQYNDEVGVNCYTCHRGQNVPSNIWFSIAPVTKSMAGWSANQNITTVQSQYTSLPSDALQSYLLENNPINVHDLDPRVSRADANPATWQDTERTFSLMNYFSNALGVNCVFCHNSRAFYDPAQVTPQWANALMGITMVQELNNDWLLPLQDVFPENRLGPVYGDVAKVACATCHQGYNRPLQGTNMIGDWPELATTSTDVVYPTE